MKLADLDKKTICILGFGLEGKSVLKVLETHVPTCEITIADGNKDTEIQNTKHWLQVGSGWLQNLDKFDVIIASPGIPPLPELDSVFHKTTTSTQIFLEEVQSRGSTVIGITGSKGKSTTSSLIYELLRAQELDVQLVGNIGIPSVEFISKASPSTIFVLEMSSYQLRYCTVSPQIAVVTSFFPDHLDYHSKEPQVRTITEHDAQHIAAIEAYKQAKMHLTKFQTANDFVFYDSQCNDTKNIAEQSPGTLIATSTMDSPVTLGEVNLLGEHNLRNIALAYTVVQHISSLEPWNLETLEPSINALKRFKGLPHRLQSLGMHHGAEWIDDAISTTPESAIAAIDAIDSDDKKVHTIILGGQDRDNDFTELGKRIVQSNIQTVVLFPESGIRIKVAIEKFETELRITNNELRNIQYVDVESMPEAVSACKQSIPENVNHTPVVLLSTASPSYNMFKNFEHKGSEFQKCI